MSSIQSSPTTSVSNGGQSQQRLSEHIDSSNVALRLVQQLNNKEISDDDALMQIAREILKRRNGEVNLVSTLLKMRFG